MNIQVNGIHIEAAEGLQVDIDQHGGEIYVKISPKPTKSGNESQEFKFFIRGGFEEDIIFSIREFTD